MSPNRRRDRGQSMVEMAIAMPVFLMLTMGAIDLGRYVYTRSTLLSDAQDAARQMSVVANQASDCSAFRAGINSGGAMALKADPNSYVTGGAAFYQPSPVAKQPRVDTGWVFLSPSVGRTAPAPPYQTGNGCDLGAAPRVIAPPGTPVTVTITYKLKIITPFWSSIMPTTMITVTASDQPEY